MKKKNIYKPIKHDSKKNRMELLPPDALIATAQVFSHGAEKYTDRNWEKGEGIVWDRYIGALQRHFQLFVAGEDTDPDSGFPILAHIACNALFLLSSHLRGIGIDTRWKLDKELLEKLHTVLDDYSEKKL